LNTARLAAYDASGNSIVNTTRGMQDFGVGTQSQLLSYDTFKVVVIRYSFRPDKNTEIYVDGTLHDVAPGVALPVETGFGLYYKEGVDVAFSAVFDGRLPYSDVMELTDGWVNGNTGNVIFAHSFTTFDSGMEHSPYHGMYKYSHADFTNKSKPMYKSFTGSSPEGYVNGKLNLSSPVNSYVVSMCFEKRMSIESIDGLDTKDSFVFDLFDATSRTFAIATNDTGFCILGPSGVLIQSTYKGATANPAGGLPEFDVNGGRFDVSVSGGTMTFKIYESSNYATPVFQGTCPFSTPIQLQEMITCKPGFGKVNQPIEGDDGFWDFTGYNRVIPDNIFIRRLS
jgi:hypothetical protein